MKHYSAAIIRSGCCPTAAVIDGTGRVIATATSSTRLRALSKAIAAAEATIFAVTVEACDACTWIGATWRHRVTGQLLCSACHAVAPAVAA